MQYKVTIGKEEHTIPAPNAEDAKVWGEKMAKFKVDKRVKVEEVKE